MVFSCRTYQTVDPQTVQLFHRLERRDYVRLLMHIDPSTDETSVSMHGCRAKASGASSGSAAARRLEPSFTWHFVAEAAEVTTACAADLTRAHGAPRRHYKRQRTRR
jgi:hypothetical protein